MSIHPRTLLLNVLFLVLGGNVWASDNYNLIKEISKIYQKCNDTGEFSKYDFDFIKGLSEEDFNQCPDSTIYQYHYLYVGWLYNNEGALSDCLFHVKKAIQLVEQSATALEDGTLAFEYRVLLKICAEYYKEQGDIDRAILQFERALVRGWLLEIELPNKNMRRLKSGCLQSLGILYAQKGYELEARTVIEQAFEISQIDYEPNTGDTEGYFPLYLLGDYYENTIKDYPSAIKVWKKLLAFFDSKGAGLSPEYSQILFFLGATHGSNNEHNLAIDAYLRCIEINKSFGKDDIATYGNLFCEYAAVGDMEGFAKMKQFFEDYYADNPEEFYKSYWAATTLLSSERIKEEKQELTAAFDKLNIYQQIHSLIQLVCADKESNPRAALEYADRAERLISNNQAPGWEYQLAVARAIVYEGQNEYDKAITQYRIAYDLLPRLTGVTPVTEADILTCLSFNLTEAKRYNELVENEERLLPIINNIYGDASMGYMQHLNMLGIGQMYAGEYANALKSFAAAQQIILDNVGDRDPSYATNLHNIGRAYMLKGDKEKAALYLLQAKQLQLEVEGSIGPKTMQYLNELGIYE